MRRWLIGIGIAVVVLYGTVVGGMALFQRDLQYERGGKLFTLAEAGLTGAEQVSLATPDGGTIGGWYQAPQPGQPVLLYYRGNSESFSREYARFAAFVAKGFGFMSFDYRGFPASPGDLNQTHVLIDALTAFDWVAQKGAPVVIWGRSLGSGPASYVASQREAEALVLESPFLSAVAVAAERYPFLPVGLVMADQYPVSTWIKDVTEPVFVAHGTADTTIPVHHGKDVYALAPQGRTLWIVEGRGHSDLWEAGLFDQVQTFIATLTP
jgi:fermentation-respiration switch protein FrsA (DUF1100 family)